MIISSAKFSVTLVVQIHVHLAIANYCFSKLCLTHWPLRQTVRDPPQISKRFLEIFQSERKHKNKPYAQ